MSPRDPDRSLFQLLDEIEIPLGDIEAVMPALRLLSGDIGAVGGARGNHRAEDLSEATLYLHGRLYDHVRELRTKLDIAYDAIKPASTASATKGAVPNGLSRA